MDFGGPVWHASISSRLTLVNGGRRLFALAEDALDGVGDATRGEWRELGDVAVHLRRRLTDGEAAYAGIASLVDVRGTDEGTRRIQKLRPFLSAPLRAIPDAELP